jgi:hypothetical protein
MKGSRDVFGALLRGALLALFALAITTPVNADPILLVSGIFGGGIQAFDYDTGASLGTFATLPTCNNCSEQVSGIATLPDGNVVAAVYTNSSPTIYQYSPNGTNLGVFATTAGIILNMKTGPDGNLYVFEANNNTNIDSVLEFNGTTGAFMQTVLGNLPNEYDSGFAVAPNGNIILDGFADIQTFSHSGQLLSTTTTDVPLGGANLLAASNGEVYQTSLDYYNNGGIWECPGCETGSSTPVPVQLTAFTEGIGGMILGPDGQLLAAAGDQILAFNLTTGASEGVFATGPTDLGGYEMTIIDTSEQPSTSTPEPATLALFGAGLTVLARRLRALQVKTAK